jgi:hypothetical protein
MILQAQMQFHLRKQKQKIGFNADLSVIEKYQAQFARTKV